MDDDWSRMAGYIQTSLDLNDLGSQLAAAGVHCEVRKRAHYEGHYYLRIYEGDDFTLHSVSPGTYLAEALSSSIEGIFAAACRVSTGLIALNIEHKFEVYDRMSQLVHCVQHHVEPGGDAFSATDIIDKSIEP